MSYYNYVDMICTCCPLQLMRRNVVGVRRMAPHPTLAYCEYQLVYIIMAVHTRRSNIPPHLYLHSTMTKPHPLELAGGLRWRSTCPSSPCQSQPRAFLGQYTLRAFTSRATPLWRSVMKSGELQRGQGFLLLVIRPMQLRLTKLVTTATDDHGVS